MDLVLSDGDGHVWIGCSLTGRSMRNVDGSLRLVEARVGTQLVYVSVLSVWDNGRRLSLDELEFELSNVRL